MDTTCGSVLNVWKNVQALRRRRADLGHPRQVLARGDARHGVAGLARRRTAHYLVVLNRAQALAACDYIRHGGDRAAFLREFEHAVSPGFDPDVHLQRVGCANQTTMLSSESLEIGEMFRAAMRDRYGEDGAAGRFRAFDTICSATQDRQDAVIALLDEQPLDLMIVLGGYNSSNTFNLARICAARLPTYHIADPTSLLSRTEILHKPVDAPNEMTTAGWLPDGPVDRGPHLGRLDPGQPGGSGHPAARRAGQRLKSPRRLLSRR